MKKQPIRIWGRALAAGVSLLIGNSFQISAQNLADGLVSYWPLDEVQGTHTPDLVSGYDMDLNNLAAADLVAGVQGKAFNFSNAKKTLLSRVHKAGEALPINQHAAFTISFWEKVNGTGQNDLRLFSEGNTGNSDPLFNLGTHNVDGTLDVFIRQSGSTTVNHIVTTGTPLDDTWHQIVFVQQADGSRSIYIDGVLDPLEIPAKEVTLNENDTTVGGILRASAGSWVTGLIDEVALWKRALTAAEITKLKAEGLKSVFPPLANGLVSHWPMDEVQGTKTPDVVSGYDMDLNNLTAADLVTGKVGKTFTFANAKKTLLTRVHKAGEALPINQHPAFTISFWEKLKGTGQNDLRLFSEGNTSNSDPLFNIGTHNVDDTLDLFIRQSGTTTINHIVTTGTPFDDEWHLITYVQNADASRQIYIDGVLDALEIPDKEAATLNVNDTSIGGILRASPGSWVSGLIDDVALWKRALTLEEITEVKNNGVPAVLTHKKPLEIRSFVSDYPAVAQGDKVTLRWQASADATLSIAPGVGDVTAQSQFGSGSIDVSVTQDTTFTFSAVRGSETLTAQKAIKVVPSVASNWRLVENFDTYSAGAIAGKGNWVNPEGTFNVVSRGLNKVLGFTDGNALTALSLNSLTLKEGDKATLFFRVYEPTNDTATLLTITFGLTERAIRFNGDFNGNVGPYLRLERAADGGTTDLLAHNRVGAVYDSALDAIQAGSVYRIWIDVQNKPFDVQDGVQNGGDVYTVWIQKEGDANRTALFTDYVSDRDAVNIDPFFGAPGITLTHLFLSAMGAAQGDNNLLFDDFYVSSGGLNATTPVPPSSFENVTAPSQIQITSSSLDKAANSFTLTWSSLPGVGYTVQRKTNLSDATWTTLASGYPTGGATGASTSYTDNGLQNAGFYRVVFSQ